MFCTNSNGPIGTIQRAQRYLLRTNRFDLVIVVVVVMMMVVGVVVVVVVVTVAVTVAVTVVAMPALL